MGDGSRDLWIYSQLFTSVSDPRAHDQHLKCGPFSGMQSSPRGVWVTSVALVSQVSWLRDVQWVWGNLLLLAETPHVWSQGQIQDSLFPTICVWCEAQGQGTILSLAEHLEPLSTSQHFRIPAESGTWLNGLSQIMSCPHPTTYMLCVIWQFPSAVFFFFLVRAGEPYYLSFLKGLPVISTKNLHICGQYCPFFTKSF